MKLIKVNLLACIMWLGAVALHTPCISQELNPVNQNGLWGFANEEGRIVVPCEYDSVKKFPYRIISFDFTVYKRQYQGIVNAWGGFDSTGEKILKLHVLPPVYDSLVRNSNFIKAYKAGEMTVFDYYFNMLFPPKTGAVARFVYIPSLPEVTPPFDKAKKTLKKKYEQMARQNKKDYDRDKSIARYHERLIDYNGSYYRIKYNEQEKPVTEKVKIGSSLMKLLIVEKDF
jgi:hypothetical protein